MKNNSNTLVDRLKDANRYLLPPTVNKRIEEAADRIEALEADIKWLTSNRMKLEGEITRLAALNKGKDQ